MKITNGFFVINPNNVLGLALFILGLLSSGVRTASDSDEHLWANPCSYQPSIRHSRSAANAQTNKIIKDIDQQLFRDLKELYPHARELSPKDKIHLRANCPRLNKMLNNITKSKNITDANNMFYESLYQMVIFTNSFKDLNIKTNANFDAKKRNQLYNKTKDYLKLVFCETYDITKTFVISKSPPTVNTKCLPKRASLATAQVLDIQFFKKLKRFFKQSRKILSSLSKSKRRNRKNKNRKLHKKRGSLGNSS